MDLAAQVVLYVVVFKCLTVLVSLWQTAFWWAIVRIRVRILVDRRKCSAIGYGRIWIGELLSF